MGISAPLLFSWQGQTHRLVFGAVAGRTWPCGRRLSREERLGEGPLQARTQCCQFGRHFRIGLFSVTPPNEVSA
ncbi:hypothetical protein NDU88_005671 [Pleurodeles waltl]|uniref:Uncharacterized protein n=1 Tax=Pleurodeles waltl TaxID=8319 RepID=A0AAV7W8H9_PLEWA|nr:hypothetical protein NDU88_005671 [Pleurodeles waltl]